jgi:hypothetical protein
MMSEDPAASPRPPLTAEDRRRLRSEALHAVRLLSEALDQPDQDPDSPVDASLLVARLQAAVEPLRATFGGEGTLTVSGTAGLVSPPGFGGSGSLSVGVHHVVQIDDALHLTDPGSGAARTSGAPAVTVTLQPDSATQGQTAGSPDVHSGAASGTWGWKSSGCDLQR